MVTYFSKSALLRFL